MRKVLTEFAAWWKLNGEFLAKGEVYHEVGPPQLIFMAYLQRVVNGWRPCDGHSVDREYGIGAGRTDILVRKPWAGPDGKPALQMEAIELKVRTAKTGDPLPEGLAQLDGYLSRCGLDDGYLLIFDRRPAAVRQEIQPASPRRPPRRAGQLPSCSRSRRLSSRCGCAASELRVRHALEYSVEL